MTDFYQMVTADIDLRKAQEIITKHHVILKASVPERGYWGDVRRNIEVARDTLMKNVPTGYEPYEQEAK